MVFKLDLRGSVSRAVILCLRLFDSELDSGHCLALHLFFHFHLSREKPEYNFL